MAFSENSGLLKLGFVLSTLLLLLGLIALGSLAKYSTPTSNSACLLYLNDTNHPSICSFSIAAGVIIALAGVALLAMDWVTWKASENYKGRRASIATLTLAPLMCVFSFCSAIVIGLGISITCHHWTCGDSQNNVTLKGIYTGVTCTALAGIFFAIYAGSEFTQYRRRHVEGDKW